MSPDIPGIKIASNNKLNDVGFRVILIPFFGIAIPLVTGMINKTGGLWQFKLGFIYTIAIAFIIWEGNRFLLFTLRAYFDWFNKPIRKIVVLLLVILFYTIPVSILLLVGWYHVFANGNIDWHIIYSSTLIIFICVLFIVHVYETVFLVKEAESERVKKEQLEKAKLETELGALKNQLAPHFIFNSLNIMGHLIEKSPLKAKQFNENLADVYRYILQNKARDFVLLKEELDFLNEYFFLQKIRFEKAIEMRFIIDEGKISQYLILPMSLQVLVENAIKHNEFSDPNPLVIVIKLESDSLSVTNEKRIKKLHRPSSGIGLNNLNERYKLLTDREISVNQNGKNFIVVLPLLKTN